MQEEENPFPELQKLLQKSAAKLFGSEMPPLPFPAPPPLEVFQIWELWPPLRTPSGKLQDFFPMHYRNILEYESLWSEVQYQ